MAGPILKSCCKFNSLATGSIVSGVFGIILAIAALIVLFTVRAEFRTIVFDWFPQIVVKIILAVNLCMTIFISILLIVGVIRVSVSWYLKKYTSAFTSTIDEYALRRLSRTLDRQTTNR